MWFTFVTRHVSTLIQPHLLLSGNSLSTTGRSTGMLLTSERDEAGRVERWEIVRMENTPPPHHKMKKFRSNAQEDNRMQTHDHTFLFLHPFCSLSVLPHDHTRRNRHLIHQSACIKHEIRAAESVICSVTLRPNSLFLLLFYDQTRLCPGGPGGFWLRIKDLIGRLLRGTVL